MFDCSILCEVDLSQQLCLSLTYLRVSPSIVSDMASMKQTPRMSADEVRLVREVVRICEVERSLWRNHEITSMGADVYP